MNVMKKDNGEIEIVLDEVFDFKMVDAFRKSYQDLNPQSTKSIAINFGRTKYMDSSALGMLLNIQSFFKEDKVKIRIIETKDQIRKILSISRFDQRFEIS